jgi:hypothetical protein
MESNGLYYKSFTIVIYDCNDSSQYYNIMFTIISYAPNLTLALASFVNYDSKWRSKVKLNLLLSIYNCKTFITGHKYKSTKIYKYQNYISLLLSKVS